MEAMRIFAAITGVKPPKRVAIRPTIKVIGAVGDLLAWATGHETEVNSAATGMSMLPKHYSSARAAAELGYQISRRGRIGRRRLGVAAKIWLREGLKPFLRCSRCVRSQAIAARM